MGKKLAKIIPLLCCVPFVLGTIGFLLAGETVLDALYAAMTLYLEAETTHAENIWIEIARWSGIFVTVTVILSFIKKVWDGFLWRIKCLAKDSVAVYSDEEVHVTFEKGTKAIYPKDCFVPFAKSYLLLFSSDAKNFAFYEEHLKEKKTKKVYLGIQELEYGWTKQQKEVVLFDINGAIARSLWKQIRLWNSRKMELSIVIYGDGMLAQTIVNSGLLLNLYAKEQHITYHRIATTNNWEKRHFQMPLCNADEVVFTSSEDFLSLEYIKTADIVIVAQCDNWEEFQTICANAKKQPVYYYAPKLREIAQYVERSDLIAFGVEEEIFTDEMIRQQKLEETAKQLNVAYLNDTNPTGKEKYDKEEEWKKLSGFLKMSNIFAADFQEVLQELKKSYSEEELAQLEHIRWCRLHLLNGWEYGVPENGALKDTVQKIHQDLVPFEQLNETEKEKDRVVVRQIIKD